jgi:uncharacterized protein YjiS (DUF1127 family)
MNIISVLIRRSQKRRAYANLLELDDHLLRDIGINRSDLHLMASARTPQLKGTVTP